MFLGSSKKLVWNENDGTIPKSRFNGLEGYNSILTMINVRQSVNHDFWLRLRIWLRFLDILDSVHLHGYLSHPDYVWRFWNTFISVSGKCTIHFEQSLANSSFCPSKLPKYFLSMTLPVLRCRAKFCHFLASNAHGTNTNLKINLFLVNFI